ncbi:alpha-L-arabinofuranosidase C-terminal domain-containing protein [Granulicella arctica]|uniref:alpha-L-arabinofuranosidase C-terminal domain-containing protein n=1 Tax=Granulicella arctica TaxID=940613 RepID=UPI0021DFAC14|nr:alpha-L-arabinofuranosidase C-terminal domain-containing protein [Granulicella arctica]
MRTTYFHLRPGFTNSLLLATICIAIAGPLCAQMTESAPIATAPIAIRVTRPATEQVISPMLFGSFLEPIGHSTYGGLWADAVENPSFEEGLWSAGNVDSMLHAHPELRRASQLGLPLPWQPLDQSQGARYLPVRGDAANSAQSVLIMAMPDKEVGILQEVYLPVQRELSYKGSLWVKHVQGGDAVSLTLRRHAHPDQILASASIQATSAEWKKYMFSLDLKPNTVERLEPVDLVLSITNEARIQVDNVSLNPADAVDGMDPEVIDMARELHSPVLRFGGNFTSAYDWHDGIGPLDKRVSKLNLSWGIPEYNTFGTDEFLRFCELIHSQPQVALNLGTGTPAQAGEWVHYIDQHWERHKGGLLWEMGNELWGDFQTGYPTITRVAPLTLSYSQAIRKVDPRAVLIATGGDEDSYRDWNAKQLSNPAGTFNFLSTHFVVNDAVQMPHASSEFRTMAALALPWGLAERMRAIKQQAGEAGHPDARVAFTEWLMISNDHTGPNYTNMGGALFAAGFLNMVMRNADTVSISDMTGILEFGGIWKKRGQVYGAPAYWVLRTLASAKPHTLLTVSTTSPTYSIKRGVNRLPEIAEVPYLDVVATVSEDKSKLLLMCVNRHLVRPETATIDLTALGIAGGMAKVTTLTSENILTENDEEEPNRIIPIVHNETVQATFSHTFPNASVTLIEIPLSK